MNDDPIVADVRRIREELAERFDFDVGAIFADLRERQAKLGSRLVRRAKERQADSADAPDGGSGPIHPGR